MKGFLYVEARIGVLVQYLEWAKWEGSIGWPRRETTQSNLRGSTNYVLR